jgi:hypothetical protein
MRSKRMVLRQALRKRPGVYQAREIQKETGATRSLVRAVLVEMERAGEVVRWGPRGYTRWQVLPRDIRPEATLWYRWGWPDPMAWPRDGVPLGYSGT